MSTSWRHFMMGFERSQRRLKVWERKECKIAAINCKKNKEKEGWKDMKDDGRTIGRYIHHHLFLQMVRAGSLSVARVCLSRRPTFSSVSTMRRRLVGVFGSFCHHRLARRWSGFQGFLPASQMAKHESGLRGEDFYSIGWFRASRHDSRGPQNVRSH